MKKIILLTTLILFSSQSIARYSFSTCTKRGDAPSCTGSCEVDKKLAMDFKINTENNTIIVLNYSGNKLNYSESIDNCKIADNKNWQCSNGFSMINDAWYIDGSSGGLCGKYSIFR